MQVDPLVVAAFVIRGLPPYAIIVAAWWLTRRLAVQRSSPGLMLASMGFLVKLVIDATWNLVWWVYLGGIYQLAFLSERGMSIAQVGWVLYLTSIVSGIVGAASYAAMTIMVFYGARRVLRANFGLH